jgi:hypothetical protein
MKNILMLLSASILMLLVACNEKQPSKVESDESILSIKHSRIYGECLGYCDKSLEITIDSTKMIFIKSINGLGKIDTIIKSSKTDQKFWDSIQKLISINEFFNLDSAYYPIDETDECRNRILLKTNYKFKKVDFGDGVQNPIVLKIYNYEMYLRSIYGIDTIKLD